MPRVSTKKTAKKAVKAIAAPPAAREPITEPAPEMAVEESEIELVSPVAPAPRAKEIAVSSSLIKIKPLTGW